VGWWACPILAVLVVADCRAGDLSDRSGNADSLQPESSSQRGFDPDRLADAWERTSRRSSGEPLDNPPHLQATTGLGTVFLQVAFSLTVVIGSIYGVGYFLRRYLGKSFLTTAGPLKVLAKHSLSQKSSVYLVGALNRFLVIGESSHGLTCLAEFSDAKEIEKLKDQWGWEWGVPGEKNRLYTPKTSPFRSTLQSHVTDLERELERIKEASG